MTVYVLICLSLSLVGVAGLQFFYLAYAEWVKREHLKRIRELETYSRTLADKLYECEVQLKEQTELIDTFYGETQTEEVWADVIEDF